MNEPSFLPARKRVSSTAIIPGLTLITGPRGAGKTTFCAALVAQAREAHLSVGGILCPADIQDGVKVNILLMCIQTGEQRLLGRRSFAPDCTRPVGCWYFDPACLAWGNEILRCADEVDVLIIDELGPLELEQGEGFQAGLQRLDQGQYRSAYAVVRPELLAVAQRRWPDSRVLNISGDAA